MPAITDYKNKKKSDKNKMGAEKMQKNNKQSTDAQSSSSAHANPSVNTSHSASKSSRRPGREPDEYAGEVKIVDTDGDSGSNASSEASGSADFEASAQTTEMPKVEINFFGSELIRAKFPKPFDVVEAVATDWVHEGKFDNLPIKSKLAAEVAQKGLSQAKEIEKKVLNSPVTEKIAYQALTAMMKAQGWAQQLKSKIRK
jgi:hypothetical protein